jgi:hypothetical protein
MRCGVRATREEEEWRIVALCSLCHPSHPDKVSRLLLLELGAYVDTNDWST